VRGVVVHARLEVSEIAADQVQLDVVQGAGARRGAERHAFSNSGSAPTQHARDAVREVAQPAKRLDPQADRLPSGRRSRTGNRVER